MCACLPVLIFSILTFGFASVLFGVQEHLGELWIQQHDEMAPSDVFLGEIFQQASNGPSTNVGKVVRSENVLVVKNSELRQCDERSDCGGICVNWMIVRRQPGAKQRFPKYINKPFLRSSSILSPPHGPFLSTRLTRMILGGTWSSCRRQGKPDSLSRREK